MCVCKCICVCVVSLVSCVRVCPSYCISQCVCKSVPVSRYVCNYSDSQGNCPPSPATKRILILSGLTVTPKEGGGGWQSAIYRGWLEWIAWHFIGSYDKGPGKRRPKNLAWGWGHTPTTTLNDAEEEYRERKGNVSASLCQPAITDCYSSKYQTKQREMPVTDYTSKYQLLHRNARLSSENLK